jgi:hypothetical protein
MGAVIADVSGRGAIMRMTALLLACTVVFSAACHPGPIASKKANVGGTIAGVVKTADVQVAVPGRRVTVVEVNTGLRLETTTASNGGYTVQVPEGTYRIEVELRSGETLARRPEPTRVNNGDLDPGRDFVITAVATRH